ncbi:hypothetical protein DO021_02965 [Desulfobacter hydrogenophilus]|uniref:Lipoprotein n=1 Tax=Desulfobacter hydrogenophilus TaxID=2291 RepID=A0A328FFY2_9BACT|nr:hypothetical protein [Desulfobacter hydrogenophilus]NDY71451.1 hypothetical protein [Desulfobacter hydrogenophilus]QBH12188.1 hypothetical protein EYB58_04150 [Desulfobacter hydrogenophilus]RAM03488.1 hypothetical protein DO021_02965 [Desulfobacter hydrogenophilus]
MKYIAFFLSVLFITGCAHAPMQFQLAQGTNQNDYRAALNECGGDKKQSNYFLFGPLILVAPAVAVVEGVKAGQRNNVQTCMEDKGFRCIENCPHQSSVKIAKKPVDPELLSKWDAVIQEERKKNWVRYACIPKDFCVYYDPVSISKDQHYVSFREQAELLPERTDTHYGCIWRHVKVNCADKIFKYYGFVAVDKAGKTVDPITIETEWKNLPEDSQTGKFAYKICRGGLIEDGPYDRNRNDDPATAANNF